MCPAAAANVDFMAVNVSFLSRFSSALLALFNFNAPLFLDPCETSSGLVLSPQAGKVMQCWHFWLGLVLVPTACLLKDFAWTA